MKKDKNILEIEDNISEEDDTIKRIINRNRDNDKKKNIIIYSIISILLVVLIVLVVYIFKDNKNIGNTIPSDDDMNETVNGDVDDSEDDEEVNNIGYVSCDDNTALLNVRNSTDGNIVDGLSCFKEVTILEELDSTDTCNKWYRISYDKNDSNYTGYACGTYIKKLGVSLDVINSVKKLINKANEYYDNTILKAYCGNSTEIKTVDFGNNMVGEYVKSEFKTIEELESYLLSFLDDDLINIKLDLSDIDNPKYYDNYYMIDGNLYCRNYAGKGYDSSYTGNYDIEIDEYDDDSISINIAYQYIHEDSDCELKDLSSCSRNDFVYEIKKIVIDNNIITKMEFHK